MLYAGVDIHKQVFHAVVLDPVTGELSECRFQPSRERLSEWASEWEDKLAGVAIEATTGWRWVARELQAHGFEVHLLDAGRASALRGRRRKAKTDKLDAKWLAMILARDLLSECEAWIPPAEIQQLRDQTRLRSRWSRAAPTGRSDYTRCSRTRDGPVAAAGCSPRKVAAGSQHSTSTPPPARTST